MTRAIGFLVYPGFQLLDATGPIAAFEIADRFSPGAYALHFLSRDGGAISSSSGLSIDTIALADAPRLDTLLVSGGDGVKVPATCAQTLDFVRAAGRNARRVASVCSGTFILAAAGLLDGKRATTHWSRTQDFQRRHPNVRLEPDRIWIQDGAVWSSAGITAGIDLALAMIGADEGEAIARRTAQQLVVYHHRPGGQSQHSALIDLRPGRFDALLSWARQNLAETLSVEQLAGQAAMSPRNFARLFAQETGVTPAKAVERLRVEAARALLDSQPLQVEDVALETGFGDSERMRRAFIRAFGQPPQALRRKVGAGGNMATSHGNSLA